MRSSQARHRKPCQSQTEDFSALNSKRSVCSSFHVHTLQLFVDFTLVLNIVAHGLMNHRTLFASNLVFLGKGLECRLSEDSDGSSSASQRLLHWRHFVGDNFIQLEDGNSKDIYTSTASSSRR